MLQAQVDRLTEERALLARELARAYKQPLRPIRHALHYRFARLASAASAFFARGFSDRLSQAAQSHSPKRFDKYLRDPGPASARLWKFGPILTAEDPLRLVPAEVERVRLSTSASPVVSIIIPSYGKAWLTLQCLKSIAMHPPRPPFEVIVVDDASRDPDVDLLGKVKGRPTRNQPDNSRLSALLQPRGRKGERRLPLPSEQRYTGVRGLVRAAAGRLRRFSRRRPRRLEAALSPTAPCRRREGSSGATAPAGTTDARTTRRSRSTTMSARPTTSRAARFWFPGRSGGSSAASTSTSRRATARTAISRSASGRPARRRTTARSRSSCTWKARRTARTSSPGSRPIRSTTRKSFSSAGAKRCAAGALPAGLSEIMRARDRSRGRQVALIVDHYVPEPDQDAGSRTIMAMIEALLGRGIRGEILARQQQLQCRNIPRSSRAWASRRSTDPIIRSTSGSRPTAKRSRSPSSAGLVSRRATFPRLREHTKATLVYYGHDLHFQRLGMEAKAKNDAKLAAEAAGNRGRGTLDLASRSTSFSTHRRKRPPSRVRRRRGRPRSFPTPTMISATPASRRRITTSSSSPALATRRTPTPPLARRGDFPEDSRKGP